MQFSLQAASPETFRYILVPADDRKFPMDRGIPMASSGRDKGSHYHLRGRSLLVAAHHRSAAAHTHSVETNSGSGHDALCMTRI
jgi:hypothetical protein